MITAERKPLDEILELVGDKKKILVAGCDTCVAICLTGGEKEAEILASELRIKAEQDGRAVEVEHTAAIRQCEWEYLDMIAEKVEAADVVLSMACGIGIQSLAEKFAPKIVVPAVNTNMLGMPQEHAVWLERCGACGMPSMLVLTAGTTILGANFSARLWMPMPQAMLSTTSAASTFSAIMSRYSHSHWRMAAVCSTSTARPPSASASGSTLARISASFSPPLRQMATQLS